MARRTPFALLAAGAVALWSGCRPLPPERNPPPALAAAAHVHLLDEAEGDAARIAEVVVARLNESRGPDERPVRLTIGGDPSPDAVVVAPGAPPANASLVVTPWSGPAPPRTQVDPHLPAPLLAADARATLALYDAVALAGLVARAPAPDRLSWLAAQPPLDLSFGPVSYAASLTPQAGPSVTGPPR